MAARSWIAPDELWELIEPLLPAHPRRLRYPGRKRLPDRPALCGILFVLHTGIAWRHLPPQLGCGSGITCWRRRDGAEPGRPWPRGLGAPPARRHAGGTRPRRGAAPTPTRRSPTWPAA